MDRPINSDFKPQHMQKVKIQTEGEKAQAAHTEFGKKNKQTNI